MPIIKIEKNSYTADSLYQWDQDQDLVIYGLSLATIPEIHFTNDAMDKAIVKQATMDDAGVITVEIPNSLLQKPYSITVHVCLYSGDTFETCYTVKIPVIARKRPSDYTITDNDEEIYSFNALENKLNNTLKTSTDNYNEAANAYKNALEKTQNTITEITMSGSGWTNDTYSFENTYPIANYDLEIALSSSATSEQVTAFCKALIAGSATTNIVKAFGTVPTIDIPIIVKVVSK